MDRCNNRCVHITCYAIIFTAHEFTTLWQDKNQIFVIFNAVVPSFQLLKMRNIVSM